MNLLLNCKEIENYITSHKDDCDGDWEYIHTPYLENSLSNLNEVESKNFSNNIWKWDEFHLFEIADPIIFSHNKYLNEDYLYIRIFSKIKNIEYLDYLFENVIHYIKPPYYTFDRIINWENEMIINLINNISKLKDVKGEGWKHTIVQIIQFLNNAIEQQKKTANK